jgi:diguanylate cyclase (GGDEF)-like protein
MSFLKHSVLALRVLMWTLLAALVFFLITTSISAVLERDKAIRQAHAEVLAVIDNHRAALSLSVWQYDLTALSVILEGMLKAPAIARLEVSDHTRILAQMRDPVSGNNADQVLTVDILAPDGKSPIGVLKVTESFAEVDRQIETMVGKLVAVELFKFIGLAFVLFAIVYRKIARHLHDLAEDVVALDPGNLTTRIALDRKKFNAYRDELDTLVEAFNRFLGERAVEQKMRTAAEDALRDHLAEIEVTLGALSDGVIALDHECRVKFANSAARSLLAMSFEPADEVRLDQLLNVIDERTGQPVDNICNAVVRDRTPIYLRGNVRIRTCNGIEFDAKISAVPVPPGGEVALIFVFTDISAEISKERQIEFQAYHDPLTQLGNRALLARDLQKEIEQASRQQTHIAILCIDLDNFKNINDALGHTVGDQLLQQLAERLRAVCRPPVWVTRYGGDEFIVVVPELAATNHAASVAEQLMQRIAEPFHVDSHELRVTSSIGISLFPDHGHNLGELVSTADMAMYEAKREGRNTSRYYRREQLQRSSTRLSMENGLRIALQENEFSLAFQPKVQLGKRRVDSMEALLRWTSARAGPVSPATFIPIAEDTGLINEIGDWVLRESLAAARRLSAGAGRDIAIAVNVSPVQFRSERLFDTLDELAAGEPNLPRLLEIELTESALGGDVDEVIAKLGQIKKHGLRIAIDDFGTGYSSLAYLKNFPIDILKIDQAFIRDLHTNSQAVSIVASVVQLGKSLGFELVAEGVEERVHAIILDDLGCDFLQGYWLAHPAPEAEIPAKLAAIDALLAGLD